MKYSSILTLSILSIAVASLALYGNSKQASAAEFTIEMPVGSQNVACNPAYSPTGDWTKMLSDKCFNPSTLTVPAGSTVTFVNKDTASHTVAFASNPLDATTWNLGDPKFDSGLVLPNGKWSVVLEEVGEHPYVCYVHPWMIGRIIVEAAPAEEPRIITLTTDNNTVKVEVEFSAGTATDGMLTVDPPQEVTFNLKFVDPSTGELIEHVNYDFTVTDANGNAIASKREQHTHDGNATQKVNFASTGAYTIDINVLGTGINKPFDTAKYSGKSALSISVVPEFPIGIVAVFASIAGIAVAMSRFKGRLPMNY